MKEITAIEWCYLALIMALWILAMSLDAVWNVPI